MSAGPAVEPTATAEPAATDDAVEPAATDDAPDTGKAGREAARYRVALRATETERDALSARVAGLQTADVERIASTHLADGADLMALSSTALTDLLDEAGDVDPDAVATACAALVAERGARFAAPRVLNRGGGATPDPAGFGEAQATWGAVLRPRG